MCGETFWDVTRGQPASERDEACCVYYSISLRYPVREGDEFGVDGFAAGFEVGGGEGEEGGGGGAVVREEDAAFFETFADGGTAVGEAVDVAVRGGRWGEGTVLGGDVAAGEDVGGGEGGGCADAVEEEDAVCGGYEEDAGGGLVCAFGHRAALGESWEREGIPCAWTGNGKFFGGGVSFCRGIGVWKTCHGVPEYLIVSA